MPPTSGLTSAADGRYHRERQIRISRDAARVLAGCWRADAPETPALAYGDAAALLVEQGGAAALIYRQLASQLLSDQTRQRLRGSYHWHLVRGEVREIAVRSAAKRLEEAGVDWLLMKGWSVARHYWQPARRPCGDLDLLVRPQDVGRAEAALRGFDTAVCPIDLQTGLSPDVLPLYERSLEELFGRAVEAPLNGVRIPVLGAEEHFRLLCLHLWKHAAWRPLWLCDVAAALEAQAPGFDWERCRRGSRRGQDWVEAACRLAAELLGADLRGTPFENAARPLPTWLVETVLLHWHRDVWNWSLNPLTTCLKHWRQRGMLRDYFRRRSPDPIRAALRTGGPFGGPPRWPQQVVAAGYDLAGTPVRVVGRIWRGTKATFLKSGYPFVAGGNPRPPMLGER